jgi:hypothetical protein
MYLMVWSFRKYYLEGRREGGEGRRGSYCIVRPNDMRHFMKVNSPDISSAALHQGTSVRSRCTGGIH